MKSIHQSFSKDSSYIYFILTIIKQENIFIAYVYLCGLSKSRKINHNILFSPEILKNNNFNLLFYPIWVGTKNGTLNASCWTYNITKIINNILTYLIFMAHTKRLVYPWKLRAPVAFSSCELDSNTSKIFLPSRFHLYCCLLKYLKIALSLYCFK